MPKKSRTIKDMKLWKALEFEKRKQPVLFPMPRPRFDSHCIYNPTAVSEKGYIYLLYRGEGGEGISRIGLAKSKDGVRFKRFKKPVIDVSPKEKLYKFETRGCEDPRIVKIGKLYFLTYTSWNERKTRMSLATSENLTRWKKRGPVIQKTGFKDNPAKSGVIFFQKIRGKFIMFFGGKKIQIAISDNLFRWKVTPRLMLKPRKNFFDQKYVEPGPPPIITKSGILLIYNSCDNNMVFQPGAALFSKEYPPKLLARTPLPILKITESWEKFGKSNYVIFTGGLIGRNKKYYLYYGAADKCIGVAIGKVKL